MSVAATWSSKATPLAVVLGAAMLALGVSSVVHAALMLAHGGRAWGAAAYACVVLAGMLPCIRLRRDLRQGGLTLMWDSHHGAFRNPGLADPYQLKKVWRGPGWVTLGVTCNESCGRVLYLVVWKSSVSSPLWSELPLRLEAAAGRRDRQQNKENP